MSVSGLPPTEKILLQENRHGIRNRKDRLPEAPAFAAERAGAQQYRIDSAKGRVIFLRQESNWL